MTWALGVELADFLSAVEKKGISAYVPCQKCGRLAVCTAEIKSALPSFCGFFFLLALLLFWGFFNENGNLAAREEWCPVSGYGLRLLDLFFQVEFSFFFDLRSCVPIRGYNHI